MIQHIQTMVGHLLYLLVCLTVISTVANATPQQVNITFLESAVAKGAVCLDGSPPAYYLDKGCGEGSNNWLIFLEGGGWCSNPNFCVKYGKEKSSTNKPRNISFEGILSNSQKTNPDFYNWNKVWVVYCDGASFLGNLEGLAENNVHVRGARIFDAVMEDLLAKGMKNAKNAILSGASAGALATYLHCDDFSAKVPNVERFKCIADSGFFVKADDPELSGNFKRINRYYNLIKYQRLVPQLQHFVPACTSRMRPEECIFPENMVRDIKTPLFIVESSYDTYQLLTAFEYIPEYTASEWVNCTQQLIGCSNTTIQQMKDFRSIFLRTLQQKATNSTIGQFVHSCLVHGHIVMPQGWENSPQLRGQTTAKVIGDWYFDRVEFARELDLKDVSPYKC